MYKTLSMVALAIFISACEANRDREPPFKVGQTVVHKISGYKGSVMSMWRGCYYEKSDCRYYVRLSTPDAESPFYTIEAREFELKAAVQKNLTDEHKMQ